MEFWVISLGLGYHEKNYSDIKYAVNQGMGTSTLFET